MQMQSAPTWGAFFCTKLDKLLIKFPVWSSLLLILINLKLLLFNTSFSNFDWASLRRNPFIGSAAIERWF